MNFKSSYMEIESLFPRHLIPGLEELTTLPSRFPFNVAIENRAFFLFILQVPLL